MAPVTHVTVTVPEGRNTPVDERDGVEPGGAQLRLTSNDVDRVRYSHATIRSINRGDLILCDMNGAPVESAHLASAPHPLPGGKINLRLRRLDRAIERFHAAVVGAMKPAPKAPAPKAAAAPVGGKAGEP